MAENFNLSTSVTTKLNLSNSPDSAPLLLALGFVIFGALQDDEKVIGIRGETSRATLIIILWPHWPLYK